ncbi:STAS domain-containing protein [Leptolyngbyaceae cyanobacterium UHCC 1019]
MESTLHRPEIPFEIDPPNSFNPQTIVLQPNNDLSSSSNSFQQSLEEALDLAGERVIVDFLWGDVTDSQGVEALVAGLEKATLLGKSLSFQSMNPQTRTLVEAEWDRQRHLRFGAWDDVFELELERFLDAIHHDP